MIKIGQNWYFYAWYVMDDGQMNCKYFKMFIDSNANIKSEFSMNMHSHVNSMSTLTFKLYTTLLSIYRGVVLTYCFSSISNFGQTFKFKRGIIPRKNLNKNFLRICTSSHYVLHNYKVP